MDFRAILNLHFASKFTFPQVVHLAATHGLNSRLRRFRWPLSLPLIYRCNMVLSWRTYRLQKTCNSRKKCGVFVFFGGLVGAETCCQTVQKVGEVRLESFWPEIVEAVGGGQVRVQRKRRFQGEMKVQKHLEIDVSAGLSLGRHTRPQQFPVENFTTVLHQLSERSDSKSPHLRALKKISIEL